MTQLILIVLVFIFIQILYPLQRWVGFQYLATFVVLILIVFSIKFIHKPYMVYGDICFILLIINIELTRGSVLPHGTISNLVTGLFKGESQDQDHRSNNNS